MAYSVRTRKMARELGERRDMSLLRGNVVLGSPLTIIESLYDMDPGSLTEEIVIDAIFEGAPGVLTFLAEKYKLTCSDEDQWTHFVKEVKTNKEWEETPIGHLHYDRREGDSHFPLQEFVDVFPELIATKLPEYCLIESCLTNNHLPFIAQHLTRMDLPVDFFFSMNLHFYDPESNFAHPLNGDCVETLSDVLTRANGLICHWCNGWTTEGIDKFFRLLFQSTTLKELDFDTCNHDFDNEEFSECPDLILDSITKEQLSCPLEKVTLDSIPDECSDHPRACVLIPFLPHMHQLRDLRISANYLRSVDWEALQQVVSKGRIEILRLYLNIEPGISKSILPLLEATRHCSSLNEILIYLSTGDDGSDKLYRQQEFSTLQKRMVDILQQNTFLTSVSIDVYRADGPLTKKIDYLTNLNKHGRGGIRQEITTLHQLLPLLHSTDESQEYHLRDESMKMSVMYGLLRERPSLWIENTPRRGPSPRIENTPRRERRTGKRKRGN